MSTAILWLRNDLRLHDHEALNRALQKAEAIVPFYCFDRRLFEDTLYGFKRCGAQRLQFLMQSVQALQQAFAAKGVEMEIAVGNPVQELQALAERIGAKWLFYHREATTEELADEAAVVKNLQAAGLECHGFWGSTLFHPEDLPFPLARLPEVFTDFRKRTEREAQVRELWPTPVKMQGVAGCRQQWPSLVQTGGTLAAADARAVLAFEGGEAAGLARLQRYFWEEDRLKEYKETRNGLVGQGYSSKFSPWLAVGALSPRFIYYEIQRYERERISNQSTYWLIFELLWRDYFRFVAHKNGAALFQAGGIKQNGQAHPFKAKALELWKEGRTQQAFIDANMRELRASGFMSNRGRQNVASYLVHHLKCDWRAGAAWFEHALLDYDPCSNYGNWNYLAGVGNDPRENRVFNPEKQAANYDPQGEYQRLWGES
jgi:deoxyribodipyrimidine photo-lyase